MTHRVTDWLSFGNESACTADRSGHVAVVHACKEPCHRRAVGYTTKTIPNTHENYLVLEDAFHLYLNLIDPPAPLFMMPSFVAFMAFMDKHRPHRQVLIHCNQGESRAPSLALLYLAKRTAEIPADTYASAAAAFSLRFPYKPGRGIQTWLTRYWAEIA